MTSRSTGVALGGALATAVYIVGAKLLSLVDNDWESFVMLPGTRGMAALAFAIGAGLGVYAVSLVQQRLLRLAALAALATFLFPPLAGLLLARSQNGSAALLGFIGSIPFLPLYLPLAMAAALVLERLTRSPTPTQPDHQVDADAKPRWRAESYAAWALSIGLLASVFATLCLPLRPASRVERLMLQVEGKRCDEPPYQPDWFFFDWVPFSAQCKVEAAEQLAKLGESAAAAQPLLSTLVTRRRDIDTGDGIVPVQSSIATAIAQIGDRAAIESLERALRMQSLPGEPVGRKAIANALALLRAR